MHSILFALLFLALLISPALSFGTGSGHGPKPHENEHIRFGGDGENRLDREIKELQLQLRKVQDNKLLSEADKTKKISELRQQIDAAFKSLSSSRQREMEDNMRQRSMDGRKPKPHGPPDE